MQLDNDDETHRVNNLFLGPRGWRLPWQARYVAYGIGFGVYAAEYLVIRRLGFQFGIFSTVIWPLCIAVLVTRGIGQLVTYEVHFFAAMKMLWHELNAPRPRYDETTTTFTPGKLVNSWHTKKVITYEATYR